HMRLCGYPHTDITIPHFRSVSEMLGNSSCILAIDRHAIAFRHRMHQGEYQGSGANVRLAGGDLDGQRVNGDGADSDIRRQLVARMRRCERLGWPGLGEAKRKRVNARPQGEPDLHFNGWHSSLPLPPRERFSAT